MRKPVAALREALRTVVTLEWALLEVHGGDVALQFSELCVAVWTRAGLREWFYAPLASA